MLQINLTKYNKIYKYIQKYKIVLLNYFGINMCLINIILSGDMIEA